MAPVQLQPHLANLYSFVYSRAQACGGQFDPDGAVGDNYVHKGRTRAWARAGKSQTHWNHRAIGPRSNHFFTPWSKARGGYAHQMRPRPRPRLKMDIYELTIRIDMEQEAWLV